MHLPEITISGEEIFEIYGFPVTNTFLFGLIVSLIISFLFVISFMKAKIIPGKIQNFSELIFESLFNFFNSITGSREITKEIFPLSATLFILILFCNLLEMLPGVGVFRFLRSPSSDLNFTIPLAFISVFYLNFLAFKKLGISYSSKFLNFKSPIFFFIGILEGVSEISRILSLAIRLFGNLFAGEVLLIVISCLFAYILPLPFLALELLVAFIQAFIFSSLITIFYATAVQHVHE